MTARPFLLAPSLLAGLAMASGLLLAGCDVRAHDEGGNTTASISFGNSSEPAGPDGKDARTVSVDVPGFSAKVKVPDMAFGSDTTHIDNLKIFPGTSIHGVNVRGDTGGDGNVEMAFTAPADTDQVLAWYKDQAQKEGWTIEPATGDDKFVATHQDDNDRPTRLAIQIGDDGKGSSGRLLVTGGH